MHNAGFLKRLIPGPLLIANKWLLLGFFALWTTCGLTSGWNDFERDIGHGFRIWKTDSFYVCLAHESVFGAIVCGNRDEGDYGPITAFVFTDEHLLVRTTGAKPDKYLEGKFTSDLSREYFFIITKQIRNPRRYSPIGPLDSDEFHANPAVPAAIQWDYPIRGTGPPDPDKKDISMLEEIIYTSIAFLFFFVYIIMVCLAVFGPILFWPVILCFLAWWIYRRLRKRSRGKKLDLQ